MTRTRDRMDRRIRTWAIGALTTLFSIGSNTLNIIFATNLGDHPNLSGLRILLYIAFGLGIVGVAVLAIFCIFFAQRLHKQALGSRGHTWSLWTAGAVTAAVSIIVPGVALIWLATVRNRLPAQALPAPAITLIGIWFAVWGVSSVLQVAVYCLLYLWTKAALKSQRASRLDMDFRSRGLSVSSIARPTTHQTNQSFGSQEPTLHSPPRTPVSRGGGSTRRSSSTRVGTGQSKPKPVRYSNRSSFDVPPFAAGENVSSDNGFGNWDTSSVPPEILAVLHSSSPLSRAGLETIPGSRPGSTVLDGPFLPNSPISSSPPHAATSDSATVVGWSSSPRQPKSSPPSSPINFSRPTSRPTSSHNNIKPPPPPKFAAFDSSMQELIHPLFRPNSPHPPPIAISGTMVTASPMANTLMTPRTLARLRSNSTTKQEQREAPPYQPESAREDQSIPDSPTLGSPGPSIVDEADLPPILPGFVLGAGARSSWVGYGKRKSVKKERVNQSMI